MTLYLLELMSLPEENSILIEMLHKGGFSVSRIGNSFSCVRVDMALEQTINVEGKSHLKGIMGYLDVPCIYHFPCISDSERICFQA